MSNTHRPSDALAYGEYEVPTPGGGKASLAFTLRRTDSESVVAGYARMTSASAHGSVSLVGYPGAEHCSGLWVQAGSRIGLTIDDGHSPFAPELDRVIVPYLAQFLSEVGPIAPLVAALATKEPPAGW